MKRLVLLLAVILLAMLSKTSFAAEDGEKGASSKAYEHASERSAFNRFGDWFATVGRSEEEKARIMEERQRKRASKRGARDARRERHRAERKARKADKGEYKADRKARKADKAAYKAERKARKAEEKAARGKWGRKKGHGKGKRK